jgi:DNA modification methylase
MMLLANANALTIPLPDNSVHCVVGSPPYYRMRRYEGVEPTVWPSVTYRPMPGMEPLTLPGDVECEHVWASEQQVTHRLQSNLGDNSTFSTDRNDRIVESQLEHATCRICGAWRGTLGNEPTLEMFIGHLVAIFREVRRVLRDDGTMWLNLGDSYVSQGGPGQSRRGVPGLKPKDLMMAPHRVALALQADGWWVRNDNVWVKGLSFCEDYAGSCMPESVTSRCTKAHEYVFMLTAKSRYFWDQEAVKEKAVGNDPRNKNHKYTDAWNGGDRFQRTKAGLVDVGPVSKRNLRDVWAIANHDVEFAKFCAAQGIDVSALVAAYLDGQHSLKSAWAVNPGSYKGGHYAVFPPELVEPCIKAGTSEKGVCSECGEPWKRVVEKQTESRSNAALAGTEKIQGKGHVTSQVRDDHDVRNGPTAASKTVSWRPTCDCDAGEPVPAIVLDPFAGSGTTGEVARRLGRDAVLLDLSRQYLVEQATSRLELDRWKAWHRGGNGQERLSVTGLPLFERQEVAV